MFSIYCEDQFTVEPVKVISKHNGETRLSPPLIPRRFEVEVSYINACCGLSETPEAICKLLNKMAYKARPSSEKEDILEVLVPPTRADVLHPCDIVSHAYLIPERSIRASLLIPQVDGRCCRSVRLQQPTSNLAKQIGNHWPTSKDKQTCRHREDRMRHGRLVRYVAPQAYRSYPSSLRWCLLTREA